MRKRLFGGLVAGAAVIGLVGGAAMSLADTGADDPAADVRAVRQNATSCPIQSPTGTPTGAPASSPGVSAERGGQVALDATRGGQITDIEFEQEHGRPVWDVEIVNGDREYDVDVDSETGEVLRVRWDDRDDDSSGRGSDDDRNDRDDRDEDDRDDDDRDDDGEPDDDDDRDDDGEPDD